MPPWESGLKGNLLGKFLVPGFRVLIFGNLGIYFPIRNSYNIDLLAKPSEIAKGQSANTPSVI